MVILKCARCKKRLQTYVIETKRYNKSPVKKCRRCGAIYGDPRYEEIAIVGIPKDHFQIIGYIVLAILGALFLYRGIHLLPYHQVGMPVQSRWYLPILLIVMGGACIFGGLMEILSIKIGWKKKIFERWRKESEQRLSDKQYAYLLQSLGYKVPEKYL